MLRCYERKCLHDVNCEELLFLYEYASANLFYFQYSTLLIVIFLLEVAVGIAGIILKNRTEEFLAGALHSSMDQYGNDTEITAVWDNIQRQVK